MSLLPFEADVKNSTEERVAAELNNMYLTAVDLESAAQTLDSLEHPLQTIAGVKATKYFLDGMKRIELGKKRLAECRAIVGFYTKKDLLS
jgi:hypothetical protein